MPLLLLCPTGSGVRRPATSIHGGAARLRPRARRLARAVLLLGAVLLAGTPAARAQVQPNFKPLERSDVTEEEQKLLVIRGIEVGGDYAMRLRQNLDKNLTGLDTSTTMDQDFRLRMSTVFNDDVSMKLTLQTATKALDTGSLRLQQSENQNRGVEQSTESLQLVAREAFLQYRFNPNSAVNLGQFDLEMGDMHGKVYHAIASGIGFDCWIGTWCMPVTAVKVGPASPDWLYDWALRYRAWDERTDGMRRVFEAEIFRMIYTESNIPLGTNLGPGTFNPNCPGSSSGSSTYNLTCIDPSQLFDNSRPGATGNPIYYDAFSYDYFGVRLHWETPSFFSSFDFTEGQGTRAYHLYNSPTGGGVSRDLTGPVMGSVQGPLFNQQSVQGYVTELELGMRWAPDKRGRVGLRFMTASGDANRLQVDATGRYISPDGSAYNKGLNGYYEITPGSYQGTRLYFNGNDALVDMGAGLGHSVNNKQLIGMFMDWADPEGSHIGYSGGLYNLGLNNAILNAAGRRVTNVGVELDNMLIWYVHKPLEIQFEFNVIGGGNAMSINDYTPPPTDQEIFIQTLMRVVYRF